MQNHKLFKETIEFINKAPAQMVVVVLENLEYDFTPIGDYTDVVKEVILCTKCEAGTATLITTTKVEDVTIPNHTIIDVESFENGKEFEQVLVMTLFNEGKLLPLMKHVDTDGDGEWDELQTYDVGTDKYIVTPADAPVVTTPVKVVSKEEVKTPVKEVPKDTPKQEVKEVSKEEVKTPVKDSGKQTGTKTGDRK